MASLNLTENNVKLMKAVCKNMQASIDWEAVKDDAGMKTSKYARDQWAALRTKLVGTDGGATTTSTPKKNASPAKRKAGGEDNDDAETPAPKKKTTAKKGKKSKAEQAAEETEGENIVVKHEEPNEAGDLLDGLA